MADGRVTLFVPDGRAAIRNELNLFVDWYNEHRPNSALDGCTPNEVYHGFAARQPPSTLRAKIGMAKAFEMCEATDVGRRSSGSGVHASGRLSRRSQASSDRDAQSSGLKIQYAVEASLAAERLRAASDERRPAPCCSTELSKIGHFNLSRHAKSHGICLNNRAYQFG